jgi:DNA-binding response OmpR family regulator
MRVLVAEDDERLSRAVRDALEASSFIVDVEADGELAHYRADTESYDAVLLDLGLPTLEGLTVLRRWRKGGRAMPVLLVPARNDWQERVEAFEAGADDYLDNPFQMAELLARLRAVIRRTNGAATSRLEFDRFVLDLRLMQLTDEDGVPVALTPQEYRLLAYLVQHRGEVVSQLTLLEHLYNQDRDRDPNSIEVLVGRLRKRLGQRVIRTRRGFGYYIEPRGD